MSSIDESEPIHPSESDASRSPVLLFSAFFLALGSSFLVWLGVTILRNPVFRLALSSAGQEGTGIPSPVMAFLLEFGFVLPLLTLGLGIILLWLGWKLRTRDIGIALWTRTALNWLSIGTGVVILFNLFRLLSATLVSKPGQERLLDQGRINTIIVFSVILAILVLCSLWLKRNVHQHFQGREALLGQEVRFAWNLLIPSLAVFVLVAARPLEQTIIRSLTDKRFAGQEVPNFVGLRNYQNLLSGRLDIVGCRANAVGDGCATAPNGAIVWESIDRELLREGYRTVWNIRVPFRKAPMALAISGLDKDFIRAIGTTLVFTAIAVSLELVVALFIAVTVNSSFWGRGLMRAVMLVPWAIPTVISARLWNLMLKDTSAGIINKVLMDIGILDAPQAWLSVSSLQIPSAIMVDVWKTSAFMALLLLAGLQVIPSDLYEAAAVDGANRFQQFFRLTLPLLRPTIAVALVFRTLDSLRVFDLFNVLFGRQQLTMATYNYEMLVNNQKDGYASAVSIIIFLLISVFAFIYVRMIRVEAD